MLIAKGSNLNIRDKYGLTARHIAASKDVKFSKIVFALLNKCADYKLTNSQGDTALDLAKRRSHDLVVGALSKKLNEVTCVPKDPAGFDWVNDTIVPVVKKNIRIASHAVAVHHLR